MTHILGYMPWSFRRYRIIGIGSNKRPTDGTLGVPPLGPHIQRSSYSYLLSKELIIIIKGNRLRGRRLLSLLPGADNIESRIAVQTAIKLYRHCSELY
jgi:hypothetical protein